MRDYLDKIRKPDCSQSTQSKVLASAAIFIFGVLLGVFQKWIDSTGGEGLPYFILRWDPVNYFGRLAVWILLAVIIAVFSKTPLRASINDFLFFIGMVGGYYVYCNFVLGFLPVSYMMIWVAFSFAAFFMAYVCWYAKGEGLPAVIITGGIWGVLLAQAIGLTQGIYVYNWMEVFTWIVGMIILWRKPKEMVLVLVISVIVAVLYQLFIPYWG